MLIAEQQDGLSPLARGTHYLTKNHIVAVRFIPAGAGNTTTTHKRQRNAPVYPRWRGEHFNLAQIAIEEFGLSPLARGTLNEVGDCGCDLRFIPAGAGNTRQLKPRKVMLSVYPRWRGEHSSWLICVLMLSGLSPLARGTHHGRPCVTSNHRFIPAGAGNTENQPAYSDTSPVYPRWRGEHVQATGKDDIYAGLSPLARGTPDTSTASDMGARFIPAGAGNTLNVYNCL